MRSSKLSIRLCGVAGIRRRQQLTSLRITLLVHGPMPSTNYCAIGMRRIRRHRVRPEDRYTTEMWKAFTGTAAILQHRFGRFFISGGARIPDQSYHTRYIYTTLQEDRKYLVREFVFFSGRADLSFAELLSCVEHDAKSGVGRQETRVEF